MHRIHPLLMTSPTPLRVALVGVGGTGSEFLSGLLGLHRNLRSRGRPGLHVTAFDPDHVSPANLVRQRFSDADLGRNKAQVLIGRINAGAGTSWDAAPERFKGAVSTGTWDIVISCVDTRKSRAQLHRSAFRKKASWRAWIDCGNEANYGQVIYGEPGAAQLSEDTRLRCATEIHPEIMDTLRPESDTPSCSAIEALQKQDLFVNGVAARLGLDLLREALRTGTLPWHGYYFDLLSGQFNAIALPARQGEPAPAAPRPKAAPRPRRSRNQTAAGVTYAGK